ncbi:hypothetical protein [Rhizomonospora bruguierae]|uniref:hypothetical protein n=1 Tax=Rhizomonospora bruguierae TaxID=1581705 RepID=UPI001BD14E5D|nr:hypothetical protein [Micromonospora sp. NBRC 107566]
MLTMVELRKLVDTPAGITICLVATVLAGIFGGGAALYRQPATIGDIALLAGVPAGTLVPVLAILLVTAERTHRTALTTYALTPRRHRILAAKAGAAIAVSAAVTPLALLAAVVIGPVGSLATGDPTVWSVDAGALSRFTIINVILALTGYALALAIGNAPAPIVIVLIWPMLESMLRTASPALDAIVRWLDVAAITEDAGRAATALAFWVALPALIGLRRALRAEVR